jgi:hypothetical protein
VYHLQLDSQCLRCVIKRKHYLSKAAQQRVTYFLSILFIRLKIFLFFELSSYATLVSTACVGNYWPIGNGAVTDLIGSKNATTSSPVFVTDRFGSANGSIRVNSAATAWQLPSAPYIQGPTTITMWLSKNTCVTWGAYCKKFAFMLT